MLNNNITTVTRTSGNNNTPAFELTFEDSTKTVIDISSATKIETELNNYYYMEDIKDHFRNLIESNKMHPAVLLDTLLLECLLDDYRDNRNNADGGDYEDSMHWSECLDLALDDNPNLLPNTVYNNGLYNYITAMINRYYAGNVKDDIGRKRDFIVMIIEHICDETDSTFDEFKPGWVLSGDFDDYIIEAVRNDF